MLRKAFERGQWLIRLLILVAIVLLVDRLLWPRYSRERHIDPDDVVVAVLPNEGCEVHRDKEPRLLRRLVRALSGARAWMSYGIDWEQEIILHFRREPSLVIRYGQLKKGSALYFWGQSKKNRFGELRLYRAAALGKVLKAVRAARECRVKPPQIPPR